MRQHDQVEAGARERQASNRSAARSARAADSVGCQRRRRHRGRGRISESLATQRCGMRLARRPSSSGRPSCNAWKPKTSATAGPAAPVPRPAGSCPGAVRSQAPNSIIAASRVMNAARRESLAHVDVMLTIGLCNRAVTDDSTAARVSHDRRGRMLQPTGPLGGGTVSSRTASGRMRHSSDAWPAPVAATPRHVACAAADSGSHRALSARG